MAGVKGRSGRRPRAFDIEYYSVRRIATSKWLRTMRSEKTPEATKIKLAHEVLCRDIGKSVDDHSQHTHYTLNELAKELHGRITRSSDNAGIIPSVYGAVQQSNALQPTDSGFKSLVEAARDYAQCPESPKDDSPKL